MPASIYQRLCAVALRLGRPWLGWARGLGVRSAGGDDTERTIFSHASGPYFWLLPRISVPSLLRGAWDLGHGEQLNWPPETTGLCLQVFGDKDADGFYRGEGGGRTGYIPCNMVAEVAVDRPAGRQQLLQRSYLSPHVLVEGSGMTCCCCSSPISHHPSFDSSPLGNLYVWAPF